MNFVLTVMLRVKQENVERFMAEVLANAGLLIELPRPLEICDRLLALGPIDRGDGSSKTGIRRPGF